MSKIAYVCSVETGEIVKEFSRKEVGKGKQWWTAWCVGNGYGIEEVETRVLTVNGNSNELTTYWVR